MSTAAIAYQLPLFIPAKEQIQPSLRWAGNRKKFKFYDFFAGAGMVRLGLHQRWDCVWANDNDPKKIAIYKHNYGRDHLDPRDVVMVADDVKNRLFEGKSGVPSFPSGVNMAWASFPCQDLSLAGRRRGISAKRSGAYWPFWEIMYALKETDSQPPIMVIENVPGLLYGGSFRKLCDSLAVLGVRFGAFLADSKCFVPQSRPRVFIVAVDDHIDLSGLTSKHVPNNPWFPAAIKKTFANLPSNLKKRWIWWNIVPPINDRPYIDSLLDEDSSDIAYDSEEKTDHLLSLMNSRHREKVTAARNDSRVQIGFLYQRTREGHQRTEVRFDGLAGCLRTPKGGSSQQTIVFVKDSKVKTRLLSRIEAARLMGLDLDKSGRLPGRKKCFFPDSFSYNDAYLALGDGVVVPGVKHLASTILNELAYRSATT